MNIDMKFLFGWLAFMRNLHTSKRPWTNSTKKGPGRKHQQGKPITKDERIAFANKGTDQVLKGN